MRGLLIAIRPMYLGGGLLLFALGAALADGPRDLQALLDLRAPRTLALALGTIVVVLVHVITHYVNDAEDVETDERSDPTAFTGGSRAIQRGLVTPGRLLRVSAALGVATAAIAAFELARGDRVAAALYLAILFFGYAYSGRPFMLGRRGLSEVDAALVMGVLVPLAGAHAAGGINRATWAAAGVLFVETVFARLCTAFPDLDADRETGKRTIPAIVGARGSVWVFAAVGLLVAGVGLALAPLLPSPAWQRARALGVALAALGGAWAIGSGLAKRRPLVMPLTGVVAYGFSQVVLLATAWHAGR
jgi:1,4-dihydroxy-2-naphthoate octaprenyltransferase